MILAKKFCPIYLLTVLALLGCQERAVEIDLRYDGDKLLITSHLLADAPLEVYLEHTYKPVGLIPEDPTVSNANVYLIKDGRDTTLLAPAGNGIYVSDLLVAAGSSYVVRAIAPGYETAQSRPVRVPATGVEVRYNIEKNVCGVFDDRKIYALVKVYFNTIRPENEIFVLSLVSVYSDRNIANILFINDNIVATEESCTASYAVRRKGEDPKPGVTLIKGSCMPVPGDPISISISTVTSTRVNPGTDSARSEREPASKLVLRVGKATQSWFDWSRIDNNQPIDIDNWLLTPQKTFTNIENGYGLVYASNETLIDIAL